MWDLGSGEGWGQKVEEGGKLGEYCGFCVGVREAEGFEAQEEGFNFCGGAGGEAAESELGFVGWGWWGGGGGVFLCWCWGG